MSADAAPRLRRYRRFVVAFSVFGGLALGVGVGSLAAWTGTWWLVLILLIPLGIRAVGLAVGRLRTIDPAVWIWPAVALPVAGLTVMLVPPDRAWVGIVMAVAAWVVLIIAGGVLEVVLDPDGTIAGSTE